MAQSQARGYNFDKFDIYAQLGSELDDFFKKKIKIGGSASNQKLGYDFNQAETLQVVEFVKGSRFSDGETDAQGNRKVYLNDSTFKADVASKQIDIDTKDVAFVPESSDDQYACVVIRKKFKRWAKDTGLGVELNQMVEDFPAYGTKVIKRRGKAYDQVPLDKLRNQQDAKSLNTASYAIIEHNLKYWEAYDMPDWDLSGLEGCAWDEDFTVYERYGRVPRRFFDATADELESVDTVSFIVRDKKGKKLRSKLLFIEQIDERPFEEAHWKRVAGRWLGVGEIEQNFENQKARNYVFNLRLRSAMWSSKKIFQSTSDEVAKNLVTEVPDGSVLKIDTGGEVTAVNVGSQALGDYQAIDQVVQENGSQKSFTFEVATGESLPSGTPFRLGVVLANSVNSHFALKREKLSLLILSWLYNGVLPEFERDLERESIEFFAEGAEGYEELIDAVSDARVAEFVHTSSLAGRVPTQEEQDAFREQVVSLRGFEIKALRKTFKDLKYKIDIVITGENVDLDKKVATLTSLYQALVAEGDLENARTVLRRVIALTGEKVPSGAMKTPQVAAAPATPTMPAVSTIPANAPSAA